MKTILMIAGLFGQAVFSAAAVSDHTRILMVNFDNDSYFYGSDTNRYTVAGLEAWIDTIAQGGVTHVMMCPSGQRPSYASKVWEPIWASIGKQKDLCGSLTNIYAVNTKRLAAAGIDPYAVWIRRCRERGVSPWLSPRMNDTHQANLPDCGFRSTDFYRSHPECWRIPNVSASGLNFAKSAVRAQTLALVREQVDVYDIDGLECDWMRFPSVLAPGRETIDAHWVTDFMRGVRAAARAAAAKWGHPMQISVRMPSTLAAATAFGLDIEAWAREGLVDFIVPVNILDTADYEMPVMEWRERIGAIAPRIQIIAGMDGQVSAGPGTGVGCITLEQRRGWADVVYAQGASGLSFFNVCFAPFADVRQETYRRGGFSLETIRSSARRYPVTFRDCVAEKGDRRIQLPVPVAKGGRFEIRVGTAPASHEAVSLTLGVDGAKAPVLSVRLNGREPIASAAVLMPKNPYVFGPHSLTKALRQYDFPAAAVVAGTNRVEVGAAMNTTLRLSWVELRVYPKTSGNKQ